MTTGKFKYEELLRGDQIRIIELLPGARSDTIQCNLIVELREDTKNTYDAISYAWGSPNDTIEIICCNQILPITRTLADALRQTRSRNPKTSCRLWADAISINQQSTEEKNNQVKHMGLVYQNATQVLAWLGPDDCGIAQDCFSLLKNWNVFLDEKLKIHKHPQNIPSFEPPPLICDDPKRGWKIRQLMSHAWFSRVWVLQEAGLAKECHLLWGNQSMSLAELIEFACFCNRHTSITRMMDGDDGILVFWGVVLTCVYRTYNNPDSWICSKPLIRSLYNKHLQSRGLFLDILQVGKSLSTSDPRDHIYAFLGNPLASSSDGKLIMEPDYNKDEKEVYFVTACALLTSMHESPYVFCFVHHCSDDEVAGSRGQSWIPRWKKPDTNLMPFFSIGNIGLSNKAGGAADLLKPRFHSGFGMERLLTLRGFVFDRLVWTSKILNAKNFALNSSRWDVEHRTSQVVYIKLLWNDVPSAFKQSQNSTESSDGTQYDDGFGFTLVTGYNNRHTVRPRDHRKRFKAYLHALQTAVNPEEHTTADQLTDDEACNASRFEVNTRNCSNRRLSVTQKGRFALVPLCAKPGDMCCVLLGMVTPFIIRPAAVRNGNESITYHLVGESYIHGVMGGELVGSLSNEDIERNDITLR
jgi:hypothetical protein